MHRLRNQILFFVPTAAAALAALGLHRYMMANCIDAAGLLIPGNLPLKLLWALSIGFPGYLLILVSTLGAPAFVLLRTRTTLYALGSGRHGTHTLIASETRQGRA